ncbi:MAG: beta-ketoacyl-ACP synthase II [Alphaproteobacteria bacterium]|nr:beta-ketoacyl-ACP synthase II [Alphaproteobacteria bacterium]MBQ6854082.1 beta-ketoacyl-ACP synthase II [Alphaproteobacteria bacterium]MBR3913958.1 beta-ketoacyl-ACP synthase II [Alphaproteobacteria bacterium]
MTRRVVVTGMGILSPLGRGVKTNWDKLTRGVSGISNIKCFDTENFTAKVAGQIPLGDEPDAFIPDSVLSPKEQRHVDPFILYGLAAATDAVEDSGYIPQTEEEQERAGVLIGSGIGGLQAIEAGAILVREQGPRRVSPFFIPSALINLISGHVSIKYGFKGPNHAVVTACATGTHAIGDAMRIIKNNEADVMIAGGAEAAISPLGIAGFAQAKALSTHYNDNPTAASRPWDTGRDGFVMGEGSGVVVLEEYEHAKKRGAKIYGEVIGYAMTGDAHHITAPGGNGGLRAMQGALKSAGINPEDVDYINAHGTSTPLGDMVEFNAVKTVFGMDSKVSMSSTKSCVGHLLGAAGAVEAIYSLMALQTGILPPTINLENPEEATKGFDLVPNVAKEKEVKIALSNSFGFGGTNGSLIFRKI